MKIAIIALIIIFLFFVSCSPKSEISEVKSGDIVVDVREPHELKLRIGNIEGVENIPIGQLISHLDLLSHVKDEEIVLVCRSGARAYTAAQIMKKAGFKKPLVMDGGMLAWNRFKS